jgi:hypothetical protein
MPLPLPIPEMFERMPKMPLLPSMSPIPKVSIVLSRSSSGRASKKTAKKVTALYQMKVEMNFMNGRICYKASL